MAVRNHDVVGGDGLGFYASVATPELLSGLFVIGRYNSVFHDRSLPLTAELTKQNFAPLAASIFIGDCQPASSVFLRIRGALGCSRPGEPFLPSYSCSSVIYRGRRYVLSDYERWRDATATCWRRGLFRRRCALQRAHYSGGRHNWIPGICSLVPRRERDLLDRCPRHVRPQNLVAKQRGRPLRPSHASVR